MEWFIKQCEDFVGFNLWTAIFAWCNLLILYFILRKLLFKPVKKMIDSRQSEVDEMYESAERDKSEAAAMKVEYEERLSHAEEESEEILRGAVRRAQLREEEILRDANDKAARVLERAEEQIELEKKKAINDVKDEVSDIAIGIAAAVIERDVSEEEHRELIDSFIENMGDGK